MKKLKLALAVVMIAGISQAASVSWTATGVYNKEGNLNTGIAYLFTSKGTYSSSDALALALEGATSLDSFKSIITDNSVSALSGIMGVSGNYDSGTVSIPTEGIANSTSYKMFAVIFDTAEITKDSNYYITTTSTAVKTPGSTSGNNAAYGLGVQTASQTASNWTAVPEPTSGLLMLLGFAGLALRRKRA